MRRDMVVKNRKVRVKGERNDHAIRRVHAKTACGVAKCML